MKNKKKKLSIFVLITSVASIGMLLTAKISSAYGKNLNSFDGLLKKYGIKIKKAGVVHINFGGKKRDSMSIKVNKKTGCKEVNGRICKKSLININMPYFLKQKISLSGNGSVKSALMTLSHETGIPFVIYSRFPDKLRNEVYYKNIPLYKVLNGLLVSNGFAYSYKNKMLYIYAVEEKTFHIPVSDLLSSFSSTVGMSGIGEGGGVNSGINNGNTQEMPEGGSTGITGGNPGSSASLPSGLINSGSNGNSSNNGGYSGNPSGSLSLTLSESGSLYSIISENIKEMLTKNGKYFINSKDGLIWVKDRVSNVNEVAAYIKRINKFLSKQVFLKVEVIDVSLNKGFQAGINWDLLFNQAFKSNVFGADSVSVSAQLASSNNISNVPYIGFNGSGSNSAILNALRTQGAVDVISQPRLVLMDGQTRLISSGTITPYVSSIQTMALSLSQTETYPVISQIQTGLSISFTPHINFKNNSVSVTLSLIDNSITGYQSFAIGGESFSNPVIESKSFSDTVNVKSGSTILVGGILTTDKVKNTYGIPLLSKIPLIGDLFKSANDTNQKEDLLIMLTPKIIR
ncbi:MAG: type II secretion system protein GspD [Candidatus Acidulodesulfobacterium sp.]